MPLVRTRRLTRGPGGESDLSHKPTPFEGRSCLFLFYGLIIPQELSHNRHTALPQIRHTFSGVRAAGKPVKSRHFGLEALGGAGVQGGFCHTTITRVRHRFDTDFVPAGVGKGRVCMV